MNRRLAFAAPAVICAALLGYGFYLQHVQGLEPCPLCMVQRGFFMSVMALFVIAALHGPQRAGAWIYAVLIVLFASGGGAAAAPPGLRPDPAAGNVARKGAETFLLSHEPARSRAPVQVRPANR